MPKPKSLENNTHRSKSFHLEFHPQAVGPQKMAWAAFDQHDIVFLLGPAGTGKSYLATAFGISEILAKKKRKMVLTRPIVESGESLGFLPGSFEEKVNPYMMPLYDCMDKMVGVDGPQREHVNRCCEIAPIAYLRGRTFDNSVCILDEAQNASKMQLKLFLTRLGQNSKMIITGDPKQSDLRGDVALTDIVARLEGVPGIAVIELKANAIVRHPLVAAMLEKLD
jgi:phosphate starvation-inducible PhoH-like protein